MDPRGRGGGAPRLHGERDVLEHLARVVKVIRRMPEVLKVTRTIASHGRSNSRD